MTAYLTARQIEVLLLVAVGLSSSAIGRDLGISRRTVEDHVAAMRMRMGARDRTEMVARCYAAGLLLPGWPPRWSGRSYLPKDDRLPSATVQVRVREKRVIKKRVRAALDWVRVRQFDHMGRRVPPNTRSRSASDGDQMLAGKIALTLGICTNTPEFRVGGYVCPRKFMCLGCSYFRTDVSYLPELKSYLRKLLADRQRAQTVTDVEDWVKAQLTPSGKEIAQLRALINCIETDVGNLSAEDQARVAEAVSVLRETRCIVGRMRTERGSSACSEFIDKRPEHDGDCLRPAR